MANPARFGQASAGNGIAFSSGKQMRFGRLRIVNAFGSQHLPLPVPMRAEYWNGSAYTLNGADGCTTIATAHVGMENYRQNLASGDITASVPVAPFSGGTQTITLALTAPGAGKNGSVDVVVNLGPNTTINTCNTWIPGPPPAPTGANLSYLRHKWCGAAYDRDPIARAGFGVFGGQPSQFIYQRENY
jgi:MSHA biogenesis protein MshQ